MAKEYKKIYTPVFQATYTENFFVAGAMQEGQPKKYSLTAIWTPARFSEAEKALWRIMFQELDAVSMEAFGYKWKDLPGNVKRGIRNGNEKEGIDGFGAGKWFATLSSNHPPTVIVASNSQPIDPALGNAGEIYNGCYMDATVSIYDYKKIGSGVALGFRTGRKVGDGKRLISRGADAASDFKDRPIPSDFLDAHEPPADDDEIPF